MKQEPIPPRKSLLKLIPFLRAHQRWLALSILFAAFSATADMSSIYVIEKLTDSAVSGADAAFRFFILMAVGVLLIEMISVYMKRISSARVTSYTLQGLRDAAAGKIQHLPFTYTDDHASGDFISRLNNDITAIGELVKRLPDLIYQPLVFVSGFAYMFILSWKLLLATFILIPLSALLFNRFTKPMQDISRRKMEYLGQANAAAQDAIHGIDIVKSFNLRKALAAKFSRIVQNVEEKSLQIEKRNAVMIGLFLALRYIPQLVCPLYGGYLTYQGDITVGSLLACNLLIWMIFRPVEEMLAWFKQLRESSPAIERIFDMIDHPNECAPDCEPFHMHSNASPIRLMNVSLSYNGGGQVLEGISFSIERGMKTALVGPSGCGKTSVLHILCGFYKPQEGRVIIYGNELYKTDLGQARAHIALVSQSTYLYPTTIAENIAYGRPGAAFEEIVAAARSANADDFITQLPDGYETQAGEWGSNLSGGQRQRISLARAILKDAPLLLLDEPTSALDTRAEAAVQDAIHRLMKGRTVLIVAHRLSSLKEVDNILVMDAGKIVEEGTHAELMQRDSLYQRLYRRQAAGDIAEVAASQEASA
ncbi:MAG: ABC transporter ATP-binding protein [Anaerolineales bacterium]|nr:ABC transporter ATP-binding protein [Anaerolineales bacterium]